ncbi:MAG: segregation/condensation protein A [Firmicutes bacterium]|nr:segregation/condensation protein A [Bacillota bacterium]
MALAERVRRHPELACEMDVSELALWVRSRWREYSDLLQSSEEVPTAAWIVRKKAEGLVRPEPVAEEAPSREVLNSRPAWLSQAVAELQGMEHQAARYWGGPVRLGSPPPRPVRDASPWTLCWSFPTLPPEPPQRTHVVRRSYDSLADEMSQVMHALARRSPALFDELVAGQPWARRVSQFLAIVHLWHQRRVSVEQHEPFGPLQITLQCEDSL